MAGRSKFIHGRKFIEAMTEAGLLPAGSFSVVIKADVGSAVTLDYTLLGDERLLTIAGSMQEVEDPAEALAT